MLAASVDVEVFFDIDDEDDTINTGVKPDIRSSISVEPGFEFLASHLGVFATYLRKVADQLDKQAAE